MTRDDVKGQLGIFADIVTAEALRMYDAGVEPANALQLGIQIANARMLARARKDAAAAATLRPPFFKPGPHA